MTELPRLFQEYTRQLMGNERFERYLGSFEEEVPVSIRLNPHKVEEGKWKVEGSEPVSWCQRGYYLSWRPNFTMDPLFHAGCFYVQEAASMFLDEVVRQLLAHYSPTMVLDLCAAPGGKSTLLRSALPSQCIVYSNEPVRQRASVLAENVEKWGYANHFVTNNYPHDYRASKLFFDIILCDVPCSGEGMFRKDADTIGEWSLQQVEKCRQLQRQIVDDAWACLQPGGLLIYSTCTFNIKENEENIRYFQEHYDAEIVRIETKPEWNITGSLLPDFNEPVYRFIPGISRGEGLFLAVLRKPGETTTKHAASNFNRKQSPLKMLMPCSTAVIAPSVEIDFLTAMSFLRGEAIALSPDTPRGIVELTFMGHPLGKVKNIGNRANNLYPKPWRIKTTHIPQQYERILTNL